MKINTGKMRGKLSSRIFFYAFFDYFMESSGEKGIFC